MSSHQSYNIFETMWGEFMNVVMEERLLTHAVNIISAMTILSCVFLKVPQIISIRRKQSADGIYIQAMMMEVVGFSIMALYNFTNDYNLLTYMEYPVILLQIYVLLYYVLKYTRQLHMTVVPMMTFSYVVFVGSFAMGYLPKTVLSYLIPYCTPLSGFAKITYIFGIIRAKNSKSVSLVTWAISVATNVARVFTIYMDSADTKLMANLLISSILSFAVFIVALFYQYFPAPPPPPSSPQGPRRKPSFRRSIEDLYSR